MTGLFIASKRVDHAEPPSRRVVLAGSFIGDVVRVQGPFGAADPIASALIAGRRQRRADDMLLAALREALAEAAEGGKP